MHCATQSLNYHVDYLVHGARFRGHKPGSNLAKVSHIGGMSNREHSPVPIVSKTVVGKCRFDSRPALFPPLDFKVLRGFRVHVLLEDVPQYEQTVCVRVMASAKQPLFPL